MRKLSWILLIFFISTIGAFSQTESDSAIYDKGIQLLNKANTTERYIEAASYFEKISAENQGQWLADYYAALAYILAGQREPESKNRDALLDKAQPLIDRSLNLKKDEPELLVLQAFLYQIRLQADPGKTISLSQKAEASLKKAIEADSTNPRAYFLMGNNIYYTPPLFKGGAKNALPVFLKAREKFKNHRSALSFLPDWGRQQNEEMIKLCNAAKD
jgi:hypothetical protein